LENEIHSHKALSQVVTGTGHKLIQAGHFATEEVAARVQQLEVALNRLETEAAQRRRRLQQALEAQQTLVEVRGMLWDEEMSELAREQWECMGQNDASGAGRAVPPGLQCLILTVSSKPGVSS
jgi:hypothetical protein